MNTRSNSTMKAKMIISSSIAALTCTLLSTITSGSASHSSAMLAGSNREVHGEIRVRVGSGAGAAASDALLRQARPYYQRQTTSSSSRRRRLDFEIDGTYNLKFYQCVDIKLRNDDLFNDDAIGYTKSGQILSTKSYVLFHVCQGDACYYESEEDLYIVDLSTYVMNMASYHATAKSSYCEACDTYYSDFCSSNRMLSESAALTSEQLHRRTSSYITCSQCEAYGCGNTDDQQQNNNDDEEDEIVVELINDISQCLNTGLRLNDYEMYVGFMCSSNGGNGVELAIFLDDQCTMYTNLKAFSDIPSYYIYNNADIFTKAETYIKKAFTDTTSCLDEEFDDPSNQSNGDDDNNNANNNGGDYEANEYCSGIFEAGTLAFNSCASNNDDQNNYSNNQNDDDQYSFYAYDMDYDGDEDLNEVCYVLQGMEGAYTYHYDSTNSGSWYSSSSSGSGSNSGSSQSSKGSWSFFNRGSKSSSGEGNSSNASSSAASTAGAGTSGVEIFLYVLLSFAGIIMTLFGIGWYARKKRREGRITEEPAYVGGRLV